ncbi:hypothetical protein [uncultured Butyricimonas sp.]|uniref:hypothetical protein n=1 Tax=uncultured Butyricimonas sp. TaxID=1268785 RepID=UPI0026DD3593|nr:hypothetical protein [uncultured Butyricimonas sp.]
MTKDSVRYNVESIKGLLDAIDTSEMIDKTNIIADCAPGNVDMDDVNVLCRCIIQLMGLLNCMNYEVDSFLKRLESEDIEK